MTATTATVVCPQCASTVDGGESFCPVCGDFLGWREEPPAVEEPAAVVLPGALAPAEDPLARFRKAAAAAEQAAEEAQREASQAQVRLERARRRSASARRRAERLQEELPAAEERARSAERAAERAAAGARRAASAAAGSGRARRTELRDRSREAQRAEARARTAALQAAESAATLSGVLQGARAEVAVAPGEVSAAQRARDVARSEAARAVRAATAAAAELALQERLLQLRATPRRVVALPDAEQRSMRDQAEQEAAASARQAGRRAQTAERRQRRRAEREDERRDQAEQQSDDREIGEAREGAGTAERAAKTAERAARRPRRPAGVTVGSWDDVDAGEAAAPVDLEAEAAAVLRAGAARDGGGVADEDGAELRAGVARTRPLPLLDQDEEPGAISPVEVRRRVRRQVLPLVPPDDGPLTCPSCGVGNAEGRHLCRSCGVVLRPPEPEPPPRLVWWRRLLRLGPPRPPADRFVPAGARPVPGGNRNTAAAVRRARVGGAAALRDGDSLRVAAPLVAAAVVLVLALLAALTPLGGAVRDALTGGGDRVRARAGLGETPLVPLATRASSTGRTSAPALAVDGDPLTTWIAGRPPGSGERLGITLYEPADVVAVRLTVAPGAGRPRPASVTVHSLGAPPVVLRLRDTLAPQRLPLRLSGVRDVRIRLDDLYPGAVSGLSAGFAEVQLLTRSPRRVADLVER